MDIKDIAQVAHEVNRAYCDFLGDFSQPFWKDASDWQKSRAIRNVHLYLEISKDAGFLESSCHDSTTKVHPCLTHYNSLPMEQQAKDYIFRSVVHALKPYFNGE